MNIEEEKLKELIRGELRIAFTLYGQVLIEAIKNTVEEVISSSQPSLCDSKGRRQ